MLIDDQTSSASGLCGGSFPRGEYNVQILTIHARGRGCYGPLSTTTIAATTTNNTETTIQNEGEKSKKDARYRKPRGVGGAGVERGRGVNFGVRAGCRQWPDVAVAAKAMVSMRPRPLHSLLSSSVSTRKLAGSMRSVCAGGG